MSFKQWRIPGGLAGVLFLVVSACIGPSFEAAKPLEGWDTSYDDALTPSSQLALGILETLKGTPGQIQNEGALAKSWTEVAELIQREAAPEQIDSVVRGIEQSLDEKLVTKIKSKKYRRGDLVSFMISAGVKPPKEGLGALNPDREVAARLAAVLSGGASLGGSGYVVQAVPPEQALSPVETMALGTAKLIEENRDSFEMSQIFRLALYFRPLRRQHDPLIKQPFDARQEAIYLDRIWRVLKPEQIAWIREKGLTRNDMETYLEKHHPMHQVDPKRDPTFALLEFTVNDFHDQIAPKELAPRPKDPYYIPDTLRASKDGKTLYEGICAACHGPDGQGRFPPIGIRSFLALHSDNEHFEIIKNGPPQKKGATLLMPAFGQSALTDEQIWAIARYLRTFEQNPTPPRGEAEAKAAGVKFYDVERLYELWIKKDPNIYLLDVQSDIAYRIMGHIPGSVHIPAEELLMKIADLRGEGKLPEVAQDKEIVVVDMFGSQGVPPATQLAKLGYRVGYLSPGMVSWHILRNYPVVYGG